MELVFQKTWIVRTQNNVAMGLCQLSRLLSIWLRCCVYWAGTEEEIAAAAEPRLVDVFDEEPAIATAEHSGGLLTAEA